MKYSVNDVFFRVSEKFRRQRYKSVVGQLKFVVQRFCGGGWRKACNFDSIGSLKLKMNKFFNRISREAIFQIILILVLFLATVFDKETLQISWADILFFTNYVLAALFVSYVLLPRYFYTKKYYRFVLGLVLLLVLVLLLEEFVLEKIFYPNSRGTMFPGVIPTLLGIIPTILILVGFKFGWDAQKKQSELEALNTMVAESRLQFLKSQINPHFLFNNLNNLYSYALENSSKTPTIILELSSLLRYMLYDCREKVVPLEKEIECLQNFVRLQELQIEERGDIEFTVSGSAQNQFIAPLILIVFVENCFKHSTSSQSENIQIQVDLDIQEGHLSMKCNNSFSPNANTQKLSKGIGLENVQSRLELLYPDAYALNISQDEAMFKVHLELNLSEIK